MSEWKAKRFWKEVRVTEAEGGFGIVLDDRPIRSPHKTLVVVPTRAYAEAVAVEWEAQEGVIDPASMPLTRMANSALDKVAPQRAEVITHLAGYGATDLLCYRAERPSGLVARQTAGWDPLLAWAEQALGVRLTCTIGVMPVDQSPDALDRLEGRLHGFENFALTGLHDLVGLSGSLILALAVTQGHVSPDAAWALSRLDEEWQAEEWGFDAEAAETAELKRAAFLDAWRCYCLATGRVDWL